MPQERVKMKKLIEVLRLHFECKLSNRKIAAALTLSPTTVGYYLQAARASQQPWSVLKALDESTLLHQLLPHCQQLVEKASDEVAVDFTDVHNELKKKGVTRELLYQEYQQNHPGVAFYSYTTFCRRYDEYKKQLKPSMRQTHVAGEKTFVDYAGPTVPIYDAATGKTQSAVIFVGVLGASNFTFAEATLTRSLPDWIGSHVRMFQYFGGVTDLIIPDNEKAAVNKACHYDPELNPNYAALAAHYHTAILPTRPYHPKDKAKVEVAVLVVERWILARLRHQKFFSLKALNQAIAQLLEELNDKPFKKLPGSRRSQFEALEKPQLKPLPQQPYEYQLIKKARVKLDYHIEVDQHAYSVPHHYIHQEVEYHLSAHTVAIFCKGQRIALHSRSDQVGGATTLVEHMPKAHQQHQQWTPQHFLNWGDEVGPNMKAIADYLVHHQPNVECCYRIHLGFKNLAKRYGQSRLEEACQFARSHHMYSFSHIDSILKTQSDKAPITAANDHFETAQVSATEHHSNVRGAGYYSTEKGEAS